MAILTVLTKHTGNAYPAHKGRIGLEIETESLEQYKVPKFSFWNVHDDGSLRNIGKEFVLRQPLAYEKELPLALDEFKDKTKDIKFIKDSITTSVHVHLNMLNESFITLGNFLVIYTLVENILIRYSGPDRRSNLFCLPICDAEETFHNMKRMFEQIGKKKYGGMIFGPEETKYGALNLSALARYGSLEIRSFRGTTDTEEIYKWVGILNQLVEYARSEGLTPDNIILAYKDRGTELLSDIFGPFRKDVRLDNEQELIEKNFYYATKLAFSINKDWKKLEEPQKNKSKPQALDTLSQQQYGVPFERLNHGQQQVIIGLVGTEQENNIQNPDDVDPDTLEETRRILRQIQRDEETRRQDVFRPIRWERTPMELPGTTPVTGNPADQVIHDAVEDPIDEAEEDWETIEDDEE